jgi:hypothetical protein
MMEVAALRRRTGGGLDALTNTECKTGELLLNRIVMNAIVAIPRRYSASASFEIVTGDNDDDDNDVSSMMPLGRKDGSMVVMSSLLNAAGSLHWLLVRVRVRRGDGVAFNVLNA